MTLRMLQKGAQPSGDSGRANPERLRHYQPPTPVKLCRVSQPNNALTSNWTEHDDDV